MAELIERLLLITFGLSILILFLPSIDFFVAELQIQEEFNTDIEDITKNLNDSVAKLSNYDYFNITIDIEFNGTINVFEMSKDENYTVLMMRFCIYDSYEPIYHEIYVNNEIEIEINSIFIQKYQLISINSQYSLYFY